MEHSEPLDHFDGLLEHAGWMHRLARELVHDASAADDLVQDTWLAFLRARPDTDRPVRPWLASVVRNAAALSRRKAASRGAREADVARPESVPSADELVERAEVQQELARAVLQLEDPYRTVVLLRYYEGLSPKQIAAARGVPDATVRSQLHRGLAKLRERLDEQHGGERRAWIALLMPIAGRPEVAAGAGVSGVALVAAACVFLALAAGAYWGFDRERAPVLDNERDTLALAGVERRDAAPHVGERRAVVGYRRADVVLEQSWTVVDDRTGAPLADYALLAGGELVRSDGGGVVRLPAALDEVSPLDDDRQHALERSGHLLLVARDVEREPVALDARDGARELRVPSGPTVRLRFTTTSLDVSQLSASLSVSDDARAPRQVAPVRPATSPGGDAWVRFAARPDSDSARARVEAYHLRVSDDLGYRQGAARLSTADLDSAPLVELDFARTGVLAGQLTGVDLALRDALTVTVQSLERPDERPSAVTLGGDGGFVARWLAPGVYRTRVAAPGRRAWSSDVTVAADRTTDVVVDLEAAATLGPVTGEVVSESGAYDGQLLVFLRGSDDTVHAVFPTTWRAADDGTSRAAFRFDLAPEGDLHLDVVSLQDAVRFEVDPVRFRAPMEAVRVRALDAAPAADWRFDVRDATTGDALEEFAVTVRLDEGGERRFLAGPPTAPAPEEAAATRTWTLHVGGMRWNRFDSAAPLRRLAADARFSWTVDAEGYEGRSGTEADFDVLDAGSRVVRLRLRPE